MATIEINRTHSIPVDQLRKKVDGLSGSLEAKYSVRGAWNGDTMALEGTGMSRGVKGKIDITASTLRIEVDLPLLLRPMKGQVEGSITRKVDRILAGE
jgi:putative polyhydroxyalkanoate system protein